MKSRKAIQKKILILFLVLLILVPISGCWNRRELNNIGILGAIGIDVEGEKVIVTLEMIRPKAYGESGGGGSSKQSFVMEQSTGDSVFDALRNATEKFDRKVFLADCKVFILSEEAAKKGFAAYADFWERDHESRMYNYVYVAKGAKPSEVMGRSEGIEEIPSIYLQSLAKAQKANSKSISIEMIDLIKEYYSIGKQPTCGVLQLSEIDK
jgi:spore germination protein KC